MQSLEETEEEAVEQVLRRGWYRRVYALPAERRLGLFLLVNFAFFFVLPQYLPLCGFIGAIRLPMVISLLAIGVWLSRCNQGWTLPTIFIAVFLLFQAARGFLGSYMDPHDVIVRNDFWHFHTWKALATQICSITFPFAVFMAFGKNLERTFFWSVLIGGFLGFYAVSHAGTGPGGYLGDENDICLVLVMFLPFPIVQIGLAGSMPIKLLCVVSAFASLAGIIATQSRGGFLGLVAVLGFLFIGSRRKLRTILTAAICAVVLLPFVPQEYWGEVRSIHTDYEGDSGTVQKRFDMWKVAYRIWKDPKNMVFGVGMGNTPFWLADYEPADQSIRSKSFSGRAVHSLYLQLLPELGLLGILLVGGAVVSAMRTNRRCSKQVIKYEKRVELLRRKLRTNTNQGPAPPEEQSESQVAEQGDQAPADVVALLNLARRELQFLQRGFVALNAAWIGVLVAGIGISVLYYPPIWLLMGMSVGAHRYWLSLARPFDALATRVAQLSQ